MHIKEFAFRKEPAGEAPDDDYIIISCKDCGNIEKRLKRDPYSGHMFEQAVTYTCTVCRGYMNLLTEQ